MSDPAVVVSVAHVDEDDRALVLGMVMDEVLACVRVLPRALVVFVYGFLPPHPANATARWSRC